MNVRDALTDIYTRHETLTPPIVVEEARSPESPLHSHFEWDDSVAGEKYRQHQAAELIRSVRIISGRDEDGPKEIREWVSVERPTGRRYEPVSEVVADDFSLQLVLQEMQRDIAALRRKYGHLEEYAKAMREAAS